jgi:hypothetical protein
MIKEKPTEERAAHLGILVNVSDTRLAGRLASPDWRADYGRHRSKDYGPLTMYEDMVPNAEPEIEHSSID